MPELIQRQRSDLLNALLAQALAPPPSYGAPSLGSAFAQAANRAIAIRQYRREQDRQDKAAEEGAQLGQQALEALTPQTTTTSSYDSSKDTGFDPNATGDMGGQGVLAPGMTVQQSQTAPDLNRAFTLAAQGAQRGDQFSAGLAQTLLQMKLAQMQPPEPLTPYQKAELEIQGKNAESSRISANAAAARAGSSSEGTLDERVAEMMQTDPQKAQAIIDAHKALQGKGLSMSYDPTTGQFTVSEGGAGDVLTGPQAGKQFADFQDHAEAALNGLRITEHIVKTVTDNPKVLGVPGSMAAAANEAIQSVHNVVGWNEADDAKLNELLSRKDNELLDSFGPLRATAIGNTQFKSDTIRFAYALARAAGNTGNSLSNKDFDKFLASIGAATADPASFALNIRSLNEQALGNLQDAYTAKFKGTKNEAQAKTRVDDVQQRFNQVFGVPGDNKASGEVQYRFNPQTGQLEPVQ